MTIFDKKGLLITDMFSIEDLKILNRKFFTMDEEDFLHLHYSEQLNMLLEARMKSLDIENKMLKNIDLWEMIK